MKTRSIVSNKEAQTGPWSRWEGPPVDYTIIQKGILVH